MREAFFLRHFQVAENEQDVILGRLDTNQVIPGRIVGLERVPILTGGLNIYSSTARRCVETTRMLLEMVPVPENSVTYSDLFLERDMGDWQGIKRAVVQERYPAMFKNGLLNPFLTPPNGESYSNFHRRVCEAISLVTLREENLSTPIIISHNQTLKLMAHFLAGDYSLSNWFTLRFRHAELTQHSLLLSAIWGARDKRAY